MYEPRSPTNSKRSWTNVALITEQNELSLNHCILGQYTYAILKQGQNQSSHTLMTSRDLLVPIVLVFPRRLFHI